MINLNKYLKQNKRPLANIFHNKKSISVKILFVKQIRKFRIKYVKNYLNTTCKQKFIEMK